MSWGSEEITNSEDIIDSRDIQERIKTLEEQEELDSSEQDELDNLKALETELQDDSEYEYGLTLIRESYFQEYAEDFALDCGYIDRDKQYQWPFNHLDWEAAADELLMDYSEVDFNGTTYYYR